MFEYVRGLSEEQEARLTSLFRECQPVLARDGMDAVQALLAERGMSVMQAILLTRELLGKDETELRTAIDIVASSPARAGALRPTSSPRLSGRS